MAERNLERILLMLSSLAKEAFTNWHELSCTARLGPEMEGELVRALVSVLESCQAR